MMGIKIDPRLYEYSGEDEERSHKECICNKGCLWILLDVFLLTLITVICYVGSHFLRASVPKMFDITFDFQPQTSEPWGEEEIEKILTLIPQVTEVSCTKFLTPPDKWNTSHESLSKVVPAEEKAKKAYDRCSAIKSSWVDIPVSTFERSQPIAFSIMVHSYVDRFARLLRAIYRTSNVYCVHIDAKSPMDFQKDVSRIASCFDNVFVPKHRVAVHWGRNSVLEQEMICLKELWKQKVAWTWFINLTGEEFPLKTNLELIHILNIMGDFNDVWIDPCTQHGSDPTKLSCRDSTMDRFKDRWTNTYLPPLYVQPYKGQVHVVLSRAMVDYILHNDDAKAIYNWSLTTKMAEETFFATLNANAHLKAPGSNAVSLEHPLKKKPSLARLKLWQRNFAEWPQCQFYLRQVCLLTPRELPLLTTSWQLFANKFKSYHRPIGYACLEEWYFTKVVKELEAGRVQLDLRLYHKLYYQHLGV